MIYTDGVHLISDSSLAELHAFARLIGLGRHWFHRRKQERPHYDLFKGAKNRAEAKARAIQFGAIEISSKDIVEKLRALQEETPT